MVEEEDSKLKIFNTIHMNHSNGIPKKNIFVLKRINHIPSSNQNLRQYLEQRKIINFCDVKL